MIEHPLGQAIGGRGWPEPDVCDECNPKAGREVDQPFSSHLIIVSCRHAHRVP
jgi:hypothetical protein